MEVMDGLHISDIDIDIIIDYFKHVYTLFCFYM